MTLPRPPAFNPPAPRPALTWGDLAGRRVGLYGLGVEGRASLRACRYRGIEPLLVDDRPPPNVSDELHAPVLATDSGGLAALRGSEIVIKSPGISRYSPAVQQLRESGAQIVSGLGLWLAGADLARTLVITGTKGKSTTTAIAGQLLRQFGYRVVVGGNIGTPPYDPDVTSDVDFYVVEVSSYQATDLPVTPPVAAVTSLNPDHLPWHRGDVEQYYRDKLSALSQPGAAVTIANGDSPLLRERENLLGPRVTWVHADDDPSASWMDGLHLLGAHNRRNALIAARALTAMGVRQASDPAELTRAAAGFDGLPSRLQVVARRGAVDFVDDGLSTNVLGTLAAVEAFPERRVALLVGGQSRGIDYRALGEGLRTRTAPLLLVTMPSNGPEIHDAVAGVLAADRAGEADGRGGVINFGSIGLARAESLPDAVRIAAAWADPDGAVLLSPAAPSFDLYRNYQDRGAAFTAAAHDLGARSI